MLDAVVDYYPHRYVPPIQGTLPSGEAVCVTPEMKNPSGSGFFFMADLRSLDIHQSILLKKGSYVLNSTKDKKEGVSPSYFKGR